MIHLAPQLYGKVFSLSRMSNGSRGLLRLCINAARVWRLGAGVSVRCRSAPEAKPSGHLGARAARRAIAVPRLKHPTSALQDLTFTVHGLLLFNPAEPHPFDHTAPIKTTSTMQTLQRSTMLGRKATVTVQAAKKSGTASTRKGGAGYRCVESFLRTRGSRGWRSGDRKGRLFRRRELDFEIRSCSCARAVPPLVLAQRTDPAPPSSSIGCIIVCPQPYRGPGANELGLATRSRRDHSCSSKQPLLQQQQQLCLCCQQGQSSV